MSSPALNKQFLRRSWKLFGIVSQKFLSKANFIFLAVLLLSLGLQFVIYYVGLIPSKYFSVLGSPENHSKFGRLVAYSIMMIVLNSVMKSVLQYLTNLLYLTWRHNICVYFHHIYYGNLNYYKLNVLNKTIDNCDQRLTRDVDQFAKLWCQLVSQLVVLPFTIVYYSVQCFNQTTWLGPVSIYVYFIISTIINRVLMSPVVRYNVKQEIKEGDFRYQHVLVRNNAESMAFFRASKFEREKSNRLLGSLLDVLYRLYNWSLLLSCAVNTIDYLGSILSYLVIAIPIFNGAYTGLKPEDLSALISKNSFVCMYLIYNFSQLIDMSTTVTNIAAHTHRLGEMFETIVENNNNVSSSGGNHGDGGSSPATSGSYTSSNNDVKQLLQQPVTSESFPAFYENIDGVETDTAESSLAEDDDLLCLVTDLTYNIPSDDNNQTVHSNQEEKEKTCLIKSLNLKLRRDTNILITGETGCGKSSFLRVMAGLWEKSEGELTTNLQFGAKGVVYLPQNPVLTQGTIMDQIIYPLSTPYTQRTLDENKKMINEAIDLVGLRECVDKNGGLSERSELNWKNVFSPGEIQRLSFARLFYHSPQLAVLDEPTSGISLDMEDKLFEICKQKHITCLTVGHGINLRKHHGLELKFGNDGSWSLNPISPNQDPINNS